VGGFGGQIQKICGKATLGILVFKRQAKMEVKAVPLRTVIDENTKVKVKAIGRKCW